MICVDYPCDRCKHQRENIDGWQCACDAFPDGIPDEFFRTDPRKLTECNNGIKFEEKQKALCRNARCFFYATIKEVSYEGKKTN